MEDIFAGSPFENFQKLTDCVLETQDGFKFKAHKVLIAQASKYFEKLFCGEFQQNANTLIPDIKGETLGQILCFIYQKKNILTPETVSDILMAADYLIIEELCKNCRDFILTAGVTAENSIKLYSTAWKIEQKEILSACHRFIQVNFQEAVIKGEEYIGDLTFGALQKILDCDNLNVSSEYFVWNAVMKWMEKNIFNRSSFFPELMKYVRLQDITEEMEHKLALPQVMLENPFNFDPSLRKSNQIASIKFLLSQARSLPPEVTGMRGQRTSQAINIFCKGNQNTMTLYLTYDENLDYWQQLEEFTMGCDVAYVDICCVGQIIFFSAYRSPSFIRAYDFVNETWIPVRPVPRRRCLYTIVVVRKTLFVVGGIEDLAIRYQLSNLPDFIDGDAFDLDRVNNIWNIGDDPGILFDNDENDADENWFAEESDEYEMPEESDDVLLEESDDGEQLNEQDFGIEHESENVDETENTPESSVEARNESSSQEEEIEIEDYSEETEDMEDDPMNIDFNEFDDSHVSVHLYHLQSNTWHRARSMHPVNIVRVTSLNDCIYVIGENVNFDAMVCQFYDPVKNLWTLIPNPNTYRSDCTVVAFSGQLYVIGGRDQSNEITKKVEVYCPKSNSWKSMPDLPFVYNEPVSMVVKNTIVVLDGSDTPIIVQPAVYWSVEDNMWRIAECISKDVLNYLRLATVLTVDDPTIIKDVIGKRKLKRSVWIRSPLL